MKFISLDKDRLFSSYESCLRDPKELKKGSVGAFIGSPEDLFSDNIDSYIHELGGVKVDMMSGEWFYTTKNQWSPYFYLLEEPKNRPFKDYDEMKKVVKIGDVVRLKENGVLTLIQSVDVEKGEVRVGDEFITFDNLFASCETEEGKPLGVCYGEE